MNRKPRKLYTSRRTRIPLWPILTAIALSLILGALLGYYVGWKAGLSAAPPILLMADKEPPKIIT